MQVDVRFLDNLRLEASFDDYKVMTDQPVRYKGDGTAPSPFDYFLASSALCAAYFVKLYCASRDIPTEDIRVRQNNILDPENRYNQTFKIEVELPSGISEKDKQGILRSMERCTVKRVIQNEPEFSISQIDVLGADSGFDLEIEEGKQTLILGKDLPLEKTMTHMSSLLRNLGINIEISSWRNPVPYVWSVHIRDADSPLCYTNGKGSSKEAAFCSALGEYLERLSNNYFYNDFYLGEEIANSKFVHYPNEKWFPLETDDSIPNGLMDDTLMNAYDNDGELKGSHLIDTNSGNKKRGICAIPFTRQSDQRDIYIPVNLIGNLFVSNGMSAGNSLYEARVQSLCEIFERSVKNRIIMEEITLPDVPNEVLSRFPNIIEGIKKIEEAGFPIYVKDASLGGLYPVMCVTLMNPKTGGVFASFGAHPNFEVALERSLTELLQGRSYEGLNDVPPPTFNSFAVTEHNNIVDHFIDSTGIISWKFFSADEDFQFCDWNFTGSTEDEFNHLMSIFKKLEKEVYIADYNDLGANACRIIVPDYSEIYPSEDLIWDNNNRALKFRADILNLHDLSDEQVSSLIERLEDEGLDEYMPISELIGISFDDTTVWGQLVVGELKCLCNLALKRLEEAKQFSESFLNFNDNTPQRRKFYQLLDVVLDIELDDDLMRDNYYQSLVRMYGSELVKDAFQIIDGSIRFYGLYKTDLSLKSVDKHSKLIESYKKIQNFRSQKL